MEEYLIHHGIKGQRWGVRRFQNEDGSLTSEGAKRYQTAKDEYQKSKKTYEQARKSVPSFAVGVKGLDKYNSAKKKMESAELKMITAKAKYNAAKKSDAKKSAKAEFNTYRREMQKTGLVGSALDESSGGRSARLYNKIKVEKGKEYADRVQKSVQNVAVATFVGSTAVAIGSAFLSDYLAYKH